MKDAQGHGSNPRGYRGKYPDRIHTVSGMHERGLAHVRTNGGDKFYIRAKNTGGVMPKPGEDMNQYPHAEPLGPSNTKAADALASGAKSDPVPIHDGMSVGAIVRAAGYDPMANTMAERRASYNPSAVNQAITQSERRGGKVGGRERSMIHAVLKGRG